MRMPTQTTIRATLIVISNRRATRIKVRRRRTIKQMQSSKMNTKPGRFLVSGLTLLASFALNLSAAIPAVEKVLPDDTLVVVTTPDYTKLRELYRTSPQT